MYGNVVNRIAERGTPVEPVVGDIATSYLWSDRKIHYITEVIKNGKEFFTIDIKRIRKDLDAKISFKTDENGKKLITVIDNNGIVYVEDGIYLEKFSKDRHYLYITKNDLESPNERKDKF